MRIVRYEFSNLVRIMNSFHTISPLVHFLFFARDPIGTTVVLHKPLCLTGQRKIPLFLKPGLKEAKIWPINHRLTEQKAVQIAVLKSERPIFTCTVYFFPHGRRNKPTQDVANKVSQFPARYSPELVALKCYRIHVYCIPVLCSKYHSPAFDPKKSLAE